MKSAFLPVRICVSAFAVVLVTAACAEPSGPTMDTTAVYASPSGDDASPGTWLRPKKSIRAALATAAMEGRSKVLLFPGRYAESTTGDSFPIDLVSSITLEGLSPDDVPVLDAEGKAGVVRVQNAMSVTLRYLALENGNATNGGGVLASGSTALLEFLRITGNVASQGSGVYVESGNVTMRRTLVAGNVSAAGADAHGVYVGAGSVQLFNNVISLHDSNGMLIGGTAIADIRNNVFFSNGRNTPTVRGRGICEVSSPHRTTLRFNLFFGNTVASVLFGGSGDLSAQAANDLSATDGVEGNLEGDPLFANTAAHHYRLLPGSPGINAGDPNPAFNDRDGTRNDIGLSGGPW